MANMLMSAAMILFTVFLACGTYMMLADYLKISTFRSALAIMSIAKLDRKKNGSFELFIFKISSEISKYIRLDEYRKRKLSAALKTAGINLSPETYIARAAVKSGIVLLGIIPAIAIFPIGAFAVLFLAIMLYFKQVSLADRAVKKKRELIESELPRFVLTLEQELKGSRDVLRILETYKKNANESFKNELEITCADMKTGSYEAALTRMEARTGSAMLSDVVRGLLSVLRGDDGRVYFQMLAHDLKLLELQKLKLLAMKRPSKVRKYSFFMLGCFILMYVAVMAVEILKALSTIF